MRTPAINPKVIATLPVFFSVLAACGFVWLAQTPAWTMPLVLGVIAGGLVDLDNGLTGRLQNIIFTALAFAAASLAVQAAMGHGPVLVLLMTALTFSFTLLGAMGLRYRTIAFGAVAVATYTTLAHAPDIAWWLNPLLILCGTLLYSSLTLLAHIVFPHRPVQESMAAAFAELGGYFDAKAAFFDPDEAHWLGDDVRLALAQRNTAVTEAFNRCRSALFYRMRGQHRHPRTARMLRYYFIAQDVHERISSTHADYRELAESLKNTDLIFRMHRLLELQGQACRDVAESLRADRPYAYSQRLQRAMSGCQQSLTLYARQMQQAADAADAGDADEASARIHTLWRLLDNLAGIDHQLAHLQGGQQAGFGDAFGQDSEHSRIAGQDPHGLRSALRALRSQLNMRSVVFRHAARLSLVVLAACTLVQWLPSQQGYWILLTALFVCQPNYSATKSRVNQRVAGTLAGVLVGSAMPWFTPSVETKLWLIVMTTTLFFFSRNYKYSWSTFFITIQALTSLSLAGMDVFALMPVRVVDTVIGGAIAWAAVYFLWPDWRYTSLERSAAEAIRSNGAYLAQITRQLEHGSRDDVAYRSVRRQAHEGAAALSSAVSDMSGSQASRYSAHQQSTGLKLLKTSYALMGYISALGAYREQLAHENAAQKAAGAALQTADQADLQTAAAEAAPQADPQPAPEPAADAFTALFFAAAGQGARLLQELATLDEPAFAAAHERLAADLAELRQRIHGQRAHYVLWQQLSLITSQIAPCRQMLLSLRTRDAAIPAEAAPAETPETASPPAGQV